MDKDLLNRRALVDALAEKLYHDAIRPKHADPGPTVVTIEGPWGSGKSTLMDLVRERLPPPRHSATTPSRLTVRQASKLLRDGPGVPAPNSTRDTARRGVVTAWFNPWAHQSGEQVWAGLVAEIIDAAQPVLYPTEPARERYWFTRNLTRVDRFALQRTLHRRVLSPELTLGALGVVASLAIAVAELHTTITIAGTPVQTALIALLLSGTFLGIGMAHTLWRYLRGLAVRFLPGELFHGPVSGAAPEPERTDPGVEGLADPLRRARAGSLYLHQHDVSELVADLDAEGYELIVFVDDLDRCRALTTAEVFEAINLFLAGFVGERRGTGRENPGDPGGSLRARFVLGLDPVVVAGHLDRVYADLYDSDVAPDGEDPSPGWAFLRKLVHLPVAVPQVSDEDLFRVVERATTGKMAVLAETAVPAEIAAQTIAGTPGPPATWARSAVPEHPQVRELVHRRLAEQPDRSIREAMRQINLAQFYDRVMAAVEPLTDPDANAVRSCRLVVLAEIVTRWPALQHLLHRRTGKHTALQQLAAAAEDDDAWAETVTNVLERSADSRPIHQLRSLLREHDGVSVAALAAKLL